LVEWEGRHGSVTWRWGWARIGSDRRGGVVLCAWAVCNGTRGDGNCRCVLGLVQRTRICIAEFKFKLQTGEILIYFIFL